MFIPTIYIENIKSESKSTEISDKKLHHLKNVLRIRDEDKINISNGQGCVFYGNFINNCVKINNSRMYERQNSLRIFVPYLREKNRFRFLIEKLTELNVNEVHIGMTENTQNTNYNKSKILDWTISALEQSGSAYLPELFFPDNLNLHSSGGIKSLFWFISFLASSKRLFLFIIFLSSGFKYFKGSASTGDVAVFA